MKIINKLIPIVVLYLLFSFIAWDLRCWEWTSLGRAFYLVAILVIQYLSTDGEKKIAIPNPPRAKKA